ncbi:unnamed protein product [Vitrella brassicaformis CCMP3155]|uniref:Uncharacterized protein n=3 Tax=Vitrella brassicaformis TaxID=1169539 RepID=A0A0G4FN24_VITBC|nr:unnamed protein product [Vitrella brassicaformis CCMP3155]|eukprot:CEM15284.1 unnamed protein product [Vitrella brassicaformis CCMP3155]
MAEDSHGAGEDGQARLKKMATSLTVLSKSLEDALRSPRPALHPSLAYLPALTRAIFMAAPSRESRGDASAQASIASLKIQAYDMMVSCLSAALGREDASAIVRCVLGGGSAASRGLYPLAKEAADDTSPGDACQASLGELLIVAALNDIYATLAAILDKSNVHKDANSPLSGKERLAIAALRFIAHVPEALVVSSYPATTLLDATRTHPLRNPPQPYASSDEPVDPLMFIVCALVDLVKCTPASADGSAGVGIGMGVVEMGRWAIKAAGRASVLAWPFVANLTNRRGQDTAEEIASYATFTAGDGMGLSMSGDRAMCARYIQAALSPLTLVEKASRGPPSLRHSIQPLFTTSLSILDFLISTALHRPTDSDASQCRLHPSCAVLTLVDLLAEHNATYDDLLTAILPSLAEVVRSVPALLSGGDGTGMGWALCGLPCIWDVQCENVMSVADLQQDEGGDDVVRRLVMKEVWLWRLGVIAVMGRARGREAIERQDAQQILALARHVVSDILSLLPSPSPLQSFFPHPSAPSPSRPDPPCQRLLSFLGCRATVMLWLLQQAVTDDERTSRGDRVDEAVQAALTVAFPASTVDLPRLRGHMETEGDSKGPWVWKDEEKASTQDGSPPTLSLLEHFASSLRTTHPDSTPAALLEFIGHLSAVIQPLHAMPCSPRAQPPSISASVRVLPARRTREGTTAAVVDSISSAHHRVRRYLTTLHVAKATLSSYQAASMQKSSAVPRASAPPPSAPTDAASSLTAPDAFTRLIYHERNAKVRATAVQPRRRRPKAQDQPFTFLRGRTRQAGPPRRQPKGTRGEAAATARNLSVNQWAAVEPYRTSRAEEATERATKQLSHKGCLLPSSLDSCVAQWGTVVGEASSDAMGAWVEVARGMTTAAKGGQSKGVKLALDKEVVTVEATVDDKGLTADLLAGSTLVERTMAFSHVLWATFIAPFINPSAPPSFVDIVCWSLGKGLVAKKRAADPSVALCGFMHRLHCLVGLLRALSGRSKKDDCILNPTRHLAIMRMIAGLADQLPTQSVPSEWLPQCLQLIDRAAEELQSCQRAIAEHLKATIPESVLSTYANRPVDYLLSMRQVIERSMDVKTLQGEEKWEWDDWLAAYWEWSDEGMTRHHGLVKQSEGLGIDTFGRPVTLSVAPLMITLQHQAKFCRRLEASRLIPAVGLLLHIDIHNTTHRLLENLSATLQLHPRTFSTCGSSVRHSSPRCVLLDPIDSKSSVTCTFSLELDALVPLSLCVSFGFTAAVSSTDGGLMGSGQMEHEGGMGLIDRAVDGDGTSDGGGRLGHDDAMSDCESDKEWGLDHADGSLQAYYCRQRDQSDTAKAMLRAPFASVTYKLPMDAFFVRGWSAATMAR